MQEEQGEGLEVEARKEAEMGSQSLLLQDALIPQTVDAYISTAPSCQLLAADLEEEEGEGEEEEGAAVFHEKSGPIPTGQPHHHYHPHQRSSHYSPSSSSSASSPTSSPSSAGKGGSIYLSSSLPTLQSNNEYRNTKESAALVERSCSMTIPVKMNGTGGKDPQEDEESEEEKGSARKRGGGGVAGGGGGSSRFQLQHTPPGSNTPPMLLSGTFKRHDRGGAITISNATQQRLTVGVEDLIDAMSSPATGVSVKDRKYHLKTYKKCFVGREAVDWLVQYLKLEDRVDAVSVGQELLRLKYFRHVVDDDKEFLDEYLFYKFMGGNRNKDAQYIIRSMEELYLALSDPIKGVTLADRKWRLKTYTSCFVASELVDWLMTNLPLRSREEAIVIGQKLQNRGYIVHVVNPKKEFKDDYLFYSFKVDRSETLNTLKNSRGKQRGSRRSSTSEGSSDGSDADISSIDAPTQRKLSSSQNQNAARAPSSDSEEDFLAAGEMENDQPQEVVSLTDFELLKILGVGAFGKVVMVKKKDNNQIYAMKVIHKEDVAISERSIRNLRSERDILTNDHPFLVHLHFSFQDENNLYLVMDYISGGDMFFHLRKHHRFSQKATQLFAAEILLALEHLHSFGIIYRDLKPENVLFDREGHVCLTDFGISKKLEEQKTKTLCGTPSYLAPEILKGQEYGESVDWWSLGVLALEMATGHNPFRSKNIHQTMQWIMQKPLVFPEYLDAITTDFIKQLLNRDPAGRLGCGVTGAREVKCHPFFRGIVWEDLALKKTKSPFRSKIVVKSDTDTSYFSPEFTQMSLAELQRPSGQKNKNKNHDQQNNPNNKSRNSLENRRPTHFEDWQHVAPTANLLKPG